MSFLIGRFNLCICYLLTDVGFHVSGSSNVQYVVVQIHYVKPLPSKSTFMGENAIVITDLGKILSVKLENLLKFYYYYPSKQVNMEI